MVYLVALLIGVILTLAIASWIIISWLAAIVVIVVFLAAFCIMTDRMPWDLA